MIKNENKGIISLEVKIGNKFLSFKNMLLELKLVPRSNLEGCWIDWEKDEKNLTGKNILISSKQRALVMK
jgi:hypothetical protein